MYLQGKPEYGMGYQTAFVRLVGGTSELGYIFNGSTFIKFQDLIRASAIDLWLQELGLIAKATSYSIADITLVPRPPESLKGIRSVSMCNESTQLAASSSIQTLASAKQIRASEAAKDAPITLTSSGEIFKRFSAYADDFRITEKKGLKPGTFGTTAKDAEFVKTGSDAVKRYALENKQPANKRFTINPVVYTCLQKGIVQPAYGEPGGGEEVIFVNGTGDNTVTGPDYLPEN